MRYCDICLLKFALMFLFFPLTICPFVQLHWSTTTPSLNSQPSYALLWPAALVG